MKWLLNGFKAFFRKPCTNNIEKNPIVKPATKLPEGWKWVIDADSSYGKLVSPNETTYVEYWVEGSFSCPCISYYRMGDEDADITYCTSVDFRNSAEIFVKKYFLKTATTNNLERTSN